MMMQGRFSIGMQDPMEFYEPVGMQEIEKEEEESEEEPEFDKSKENEDDNVNDEAIEQSMEIDNQTVQDVFEGMPDKLNLKLAEYKNEGGQVSLGDFIGDILDIIKDQFQDAEESKSFLSYERIVSKTLSKHVKKKILGYTLNFNEKDQNASEEDSETEIEEDTNE